MPDVVSEAATLSLSQMEDLMEDEHPVHGDPMLSHHLLSSPHSPSSSTHNGSSSGSSMQHGSDPLLSSSHSHHHSTHHSSSTGGHHSLHHHHHHNAVDIGSCIEDPILSSTHILTSPHRSHVDSILSSPDSDSLVSDIDMVA